MRSLHFPLAGTLAALLLFANAARGYEDYALHFEVAGDHVSTPFSASLDVTEHLTLEAWIRVDEHKNAVIIAINDGWGPGAQYSLELIQGTPRFLIGRADHAGNARLDSDVLIPLHEWHHFAGTYDGHDMRFYLDGIELVPVNSHELGRNLNGMGIESHPELDLAFGLFSLGNFASCCTFLGDIDEIRIWSYPRTLDQLVTTMNRTLTDAERADPGLVGYWPLNEGQGPAAHDQSQYGNDGQLLGPTWMLRDGAVPVMPATWGQIKEHWR